MEFVPYELEEDSFFLAAVFFLITWKNLANAINMTSSIINI